MKHTAPISEDDHRELMLDAYREAGGRDIRTAIADRVHRALAALKREEAHVAAADQCAREALAVYEEPAR